MNFFKTSRRQLWIGAGVLAGVTTMGLLAGCNILPPPTADSTRYYLLSSPPMGAVASQPVEGALRLGLKNVELAPYLKKGSLVVRSGNNEVSFPNDARWAEPLEQEILHQLRSQLLAAPTVGRVLTQPFPFDEPREFDVIVRVQRCEGVHVGGRSVVQFAATIEILSTSGGAPALVARKNFIAPETPWDGKDFTQLAARLSEAVAALGEEVVGALPSKAKPAGAP